MLDAWRVGAGSSVGSAMILFIVRSMSGRARCAVYCRVSRIPIRVLYGFYIFTFIYLHSRASGPAVLTVECCDMYRYCILSRLQTAIRETQKARAERNLEETPTPTHES